VKPPQFNFNSVIGIICGGMILWYGRTTYSTSVALERSSVTATFHNEQFIRIEKKLDDLGFDILKQRDRLAILEQQSLTLRGDINAILKRSPQQMRSPKDSPGDF
jgi:hypothetical protein